MKQKLQAYLLSNKIHVEICQARRCHTRRSFHKYLLCNVILFVGRTICVAISISMMVWCDHCLLVALWFRFHIELAKCLLFGFRSSYLSEKCERHNTSENTTRENGTPFFSYGTSPWLLCLAFGVTCLSEYCSGHGQRPGLLALITVAYAIVSTAIFQNMMPVYVTT